MSPAASSVRSTLLVQAAVTLLFGLLRPGASGTWTALTVLVAVAAVGLAAAMQATASFRTAVLGFEGVALAFGAFGLVAGHYVPGTIIGVSLLIRLAQTSAAEFAAVPAPVLPGLPPVGGPVAPAGAVTPWSYPAPPVASPAPAWPSSAPAPALTSAWAVPAAPAAAWPPVAPAPVPVPPAPPVVPAQPAAPMASPLEEAARELVPGPPPAPVLPPAPTSAPACMTILPG